MIFTSPFDDTSLLSSSSNQRRDSRPGEKKKSFLRTETTSLISQKSLDAHREPFIDLLATLDSPLVGWRYLGPLRLSFEKHSLTARHMSI